EYGSYKTMRTLLKWENKWKKHRTAPSFSFSRSNNDYHFINNAFGDPNEWFLDRRINADYVHADFHFPYIFSFKKGEFLSSIWWKKTHMGLPSSIKTPQIPENERWSDHTLRYTTQVNILLDRLLIKPAIFFERMNIFYTHKQLNLQSNTETFRYAFRLDANFSWKSNIKTHFTFYDEYVQASSNNYLDKVKDNYAFLKSSIMFHLYRKWNVEIWNHFFLHYWLVPGFKVLFYASDNLHLLAGVAKNIHRPTLNDRYWYPGGNLDLKEEEFWTADVHGTYSFTIYQIQMKYQSSWFYYLAKNWIMWLPDTLSSLWKPQNILRVHGKGTDQSIEAALHSSDYILRMFVLTTLQWVKNKQKELIYNPRTKLTLIGELTIKKFFSISWSTIYVGKRFTNLDNTRYMPYYILHDLKFSLYLQKIKAYLPSIHLMCNNVLNTNYQSIAWFPMPRRLFLIQLTWFK
ncbi:MAG: TonB-dependent receptor, partial [Bacteroidales bacterium]|nr:TonB-dependent receptor [Bacteroidales bacterium]